MDKTDYLDAAIEALKKLDGLQKQRESIDAEAMKLEQFIIASANMLPDDGKEAILGNLELKQELFRVTEAGLTVAVRSVLKIASGEWLTTTNVRDRLEKMGFDFSTYSTSPLASISTVLRRMPSDDVERKVANDVTMYRLKNPIELKNLSALKDLCLAEPFKPSDNIGSVFAALAGKPKKK